MDGRCFIYLFLWDKDKKNDVKKKNEGGTCSGNLG